MPQTKERAPVGWLKWLVDRHLAWTSDHYAPRLLMSIGLLLFIPVATVLGIEDQPADSTVFVLAMSFSLTTGYVIPLIYTYLLKRPWHLEAEEDSGGVRRIKRLEKALYSPALAFLVFGAIAAYGVVNIADYLRLNDRAESASGLVIYEDRRGFGSLTVEFTDASGTRHRPSIIDLGTEPSKGDVVRVEYDPQNTATARLGGSSDPVAFWSFVIAFSGLFVAVGAYEGLCEWRRRPRLPKG